MEALPALLTEFAARWNAKDAPGLAALFTAEATWTDVVGQTATGPAGIAAQHHYPFAHVQRHAVFSPRETQWRALAPDVAVGTVYWTTTGSQTPTGESLPPRNGVMQLVALRQPDGQWRLASGLNSDLLHGPYAAQQRPVFTSAAGLAE